MATCLLHGFVRENRFSEVNNHLFVFKFDLHVAKNILEIRLRT
jgi:hypothetical protein